MPIYILQPNMTEEMLLTIFEYLCICEVKKQIGMSPEGFEGSQNGYVMCLSHLFGECSEDEMEWAFEEEKTYLHVVERIINTKLSELVETLKSKIDSDFPNIATYDAINESSRNAVREYHAEHPGELGAAIKYL